jgi:hypothetical protein
MFFNDVIYLDDAVSPDFRKAFTGTFHTSDKWGNGNLELHLSEAGVVTGNLVMNALRFELNGCISHTGVAFGILLEPVTSSPVALFHIKPDSEGSGLELDIPELPNKSTVAPVLFSRVTANNPITTDALEELLIGA